MVVPVRAPHTPITRGDEMADCPHSPQQKVHTYRRGNTLIQVVEPPAMTEEEIERVLRDYHAAGWAIIRELAKKGEDV